ncbi:hypothetical protein CgunFtcFv8_013846 [Champsocephalus gunnari]|uniref:Uncharacterized protein n=1 Tax=Champsocephalus gunnari TaxID=52237 RepID=A0AAN8EDP8_CHAGU|nr:hypothetical protein CgunFtcFv8_013846 [Champsocephalus gunnari]
MHAQSGKLTLPGESNRSSQTDEWNMKRWLSEDNEVESGFTCLQTFGFRGVTIFSCDSLGSKPLRDFDQSHLNNNCH